MRADLRLVRTMALALAALAAGGCPPPVDSPPTAEEAAGFLAEAEQTLLDRSIEESRNGWVQSTFITYDTELLYARANERYIAAAVDLAKRSTRYADLELAAPERRKLDLLRLALSLPAPDDAELRGELTRIAAGMESAYGRGEYCSGEGECRDLGELSRVMATSREPRELEDAARRAAAPAARAARSRR